MKTFPKYRIGYTPPPGGEKLSQMDCEAVVYVKWLSKWLEDEFGLEPMIDSTEEILSHIEGK